jgi:hypothetical protein
MSDENQKPPPAPDHFDKNYVPPVIPNTNYQPSAPAPSETPPPPKKP